MVNLWSVYGQYAVSVWSMCGQSVVSVWSMYDRSLSGISMTVVHAYGQYVISVWSLCGQYNGQSVVSVWSMYDRCVVRYLDAVVVVRVATGTRQERKVSDFRLLACACVEGTITVMETNIKSKYVYPTIIRKNLPTKLFSFPDLTTPFLLPFQSLSLLFLSHGSTSQGLGAAAIPGRAKQFFGQSLNFSDGSQQPKMTE